MKKITLFLAAFALVGMLFSGCNVHNSDYDDGVATEQGYQMYHYWNIGLKTIEKEYLDVAYELNQHLYIDGAEIENFYEVRGGEDGVYKLYEDNTLYYVVNTGGKMLTEEGAHWTVELKQPGRFSYCGSGYHAMSPFPDGTLAHLVYQQNNTWTFQIGEHTDGQDGGYNPAYVDMTVKLLDASFANNFSENLLQLEGQGMFYYEEWSDNEAFNIVSFHIDEALAMDEVDGYESGKLLLSAIYGERDATVAHSGDYYDVKESQKDATVTFFRKNGDHLMRVEVNGKSADWYQNGNGYMEI